MLRRCSPSSPLSRRTGPDCRPTEAVVTSRLFARKLDYNSWQARRNPKSGRKKRSRRWPSQNSDGAPIRAAFWGEPYCDRGCHRKRSNSRKIDLLRFGCVERERKRGGSHFQASQLSIRPKSQERDLSGNTETEAEAEAEAVAIAIANAIAVTVIVGVTVTFARAAIPLCRSKHPASNWQSNTRPQWRPSKVAEVHHVGCLAGWLLGNYTNCPGRILSFLRAYTMASI